MTKNEQNRVLAWRLKLLREASSTSRSVARTCRRFGISRVMPFINGDPDIVHTAKPDYVIVPGCRCAHRERLPEKLSPRSFTCGSATTLGPVGSKPI